jgi:translation initiation factor 2B subunit (eIF-2B alpha/beta/delta family)
MARDGFAGFLGHLKADRKSGASELARACLKAAAARARDAAAPDAQALRDLLSQSAEVMRGARPSMAPIDNLLGRWQQRLAELPAAELSAFRLAAARAAEALEWESRQAVQAAAQAACRFIGDDRTVITHSLSSSVSACLGMLRTRGLRVIFSESRPLDEGWRLAQQLSVWSVPATLITDAQLGLFAAKADLALVGADSLLADGSAVNKAGTYLLALAARDQGIPFYVCCESFKWRNEAAPELEAMDPSELGAPGWPGIEVRNIYFDVTPARLIDGWFSEQGLCRAWPCG